MNDGEQHGQHDQHDGQAHHHDQQGLEDGGGLHRAALDLGAELGGGALDRRIDSPAQPPLVRDLAVRGLLQPYRSDGDPADGAAVDIATGRAEGSRHVFVAGMWLWGPGLFTSSAFMMARAVQTVLATLYPGAVPRPASG